MVNIFFTDWDPIIAARDSCDSYVVKIPVEVGTLLSAIHWRMGYVGPVGTGLELILGEEDGVMPAVGPYRNSRVIKTSSEIYQWLIKSTGNYNYAVQYGLELINEYKKRYKKLHLAEGVLLWLRDNTPSIPVGPLTSDVGLAMPEIYKDRMNPTLSYKKYMVCEKQRVMKWRYGEMPQWYKEML
jgi:hypothetical protein